LQRLPVINGKQLIKILTKLKYEIVRQRGSHVRLKKHTKMGEHKITVPYHKEIAKGTLNDILGKVSLWTGISKNELIDMLKNV